MALLGYADESKVSDKTREIIAKIGNLNIAKMLANSEPALENFSRLGGALMNFAKLDGKLREIAILRTAKVTGAVYEWTQHVPIAKRVGTSDAQIAAIEHWEKASCFNEAERLVLKLTDEVERNVKGRRETIEALKSYLSDQEIVELVLSIGFWGMAARLMETIEIELEPGK